MKRFAALAVVLGLGTAACSGHGSSAIIPNGPQSQISQTQSSQVSPFGMHTVRPASVALAPAGWSTTATQTFNLANATDLGALVSSQTLTVRLGLQLHNTDQLKGLVQSRAKLTPAQFTANYGPTASEVQAATNYLQSKGFSNIAVEPNNLIISGTASATQVASAFNTSLHSFSTNLGTVYANVSPAYVPTSLGGIVIAVMGLNNAQTFKVGSHLGTLATASSMRKASSASRTAQSSNPPSPCQVQNAELLLLPSPQAQPPQTQNQVGCLRSYAPADFQRAYDTGSLAPATGVNIAIMTQGYVAQTTSNVAVNEQADGLPTANIVVKQIGLQGAASSAGTDEWTLDITAATGMAQAVNTVYVYSTTSLTDSDIALEFSRWATDDLAPVGNASFGGCEYGPYIDGSMVVDDELFNEAAVQGQTMFASTGDTGSFCSVGTPNGVPAGVPLVEYPAASPYVMGVGGTTLISQTDGSYWGEASWYSGGGGLSQFEYSPFWQNNVQPASSTPVGFTFRGLPDIAMDADLQTGMSIYLADSGGWTLIGGTSLASPLAAGSWARVLQANPNAGYAPIAMYTIYASNIAGEKLAGPPPTEPWGPFHDILVGSNGAYTAAPGFDYTTGMGSLDVQALAAAVGP
jgi:subtilase family serine protease